MFGRMTNDMLIQMLDSLDEYLSVAWPTVDRSERPLMLELLRKHQALADEVKRRRMHFEPLFVRAEVLHDRH